MAKINVLAAAGDFADKLRSLGLSEAASSRDELVRCLAQLQEDSVADHEIAVRDPGLAELLRRDQQHLREALAESDVSFIVTPVAAEAHFVRVLTISEFRICLSRDHDGRSSPPRSSASGRGCSATRGGRGVDTAELARSCPVPSKRHVEGPLALRQYVTSNAYRRYHDKDHDQGP